MKLTQTSLVAVLLVLALGIGIGIGTNLNKPAVAQPGKAPASGRYSVVDTEGVNLIVTDQEKNTVYFYTANDGDKPGAELHLRGSIDLSKTGNATIKPKLINPKKKLP
jgi:hypothetical protein